MTTFNRLLGVCLAGAFLLAGCGGGGGDASTAGINGGGAPAAPTSAFAKGTITGFGSIFVNGVEYSTSGAQFRIDDNPGVESDLRVGQVVTVQGTLNSNGTTGTATTVTFNNDVEGPVGSIDVAGLSFVVLGQTVFINGSTVFDNSSLPNGFASLATNDVVEVSGFRNVNGDLVAARIEKRIGAASPYEVSGIVTNLSTANSTFNLGSLAIAYGSAVITNGTLTPGVVTCVEVKGTQFTGGQLTGGLLIATSVEIKSCGLGATPTARGEVEGLITTFVSASDFSIGTQRVLTTASTTLVTNGANVLALNVKVEAEGAFDAIGNLVATKVEIKADNSLRVLGNIESITAPGTIVVNGITVQIGNGTLMKNSVSGASSSLAFGDLRVLDYVEVRGWSGSTTNSISAMSLERQNSQNRFEIRGIAGSLANPNLVILGITVNTTGATYKDAAGNPFSSAAAFFAQADGKPVKVRGRNAPTVPGTLAADQEVQIESP